MTFLVPFDGSRLSTAALLRAAAFSEAFEERLVVLTVIPRNNSAYARQRGWLDDDEPFDRERIVTELHDYVHDVVPAADFRHEIVDRYTPRGAIAKTIRRVAKDENAQMVFLGSDNAGRIVSNVTSVGSNVASAMDYDVVIVRHVRPLDLEALGEHAPVETERRSDFFLV